MRKVVKNLISTKLSLEDAIKVFRRVKIFWHSEIKDVHFVEGFGYSFSMTKPMYDDCVTIVTEAGSCVRLPIPLRGPTTPFLKAKRSGNLIAGLSCKEIKRLHLKPTRIDRIKCRIYFFCLFHLEWISIDPGFEMCHDSMITHL